MAFHFFGIRHHGPGCARSLLKALESLQPDCLLVEGPPDAEEVLRFVASEAMTPPVALLVYQPDAPKHAAYYPFAEFSPEWQALRFAHQRGVPARFMDLPMAHRFALEAEERKKLSEQAPPAEAEPDSPLAESTAETAVEAVPETEGANGGPDLPSDPLEWLARAAGYGDGETWWNQMVEERQDGAELFLAIQEAMTVLRKEAPPRARSALETRLEELREAHMRKSLRAAENEGFQRIAVVCGAWHVPALADMPAAKHDTALLKGLPKLKAAATWVPWTNGRLTFASGYGAGIVAPGWYEHLWRAPSGRSVGWLAKVARCFRDEDLDVSSAHVIEATRLAETLCALRERPAPGLEELNEAVRTVICLGDDAPLALVRNRLLVGERLGGVPADAPTVPLQQDIERQQKSLRLKPEATQKVLDLDLREANDLARSHLLHRLALLNVPWGEVARAGRSTKGTFHELWNLQWQPEFAVPIIEAARWGNTAEEAATNFAIAEAEAAPSLPALSQLVDRVLLAALGAAVPPVTKALEDQAAVASDTGQLLEALPPLANIARYGNVRQTDASLVAHVLAGLIARACVGLSGACASLDDDAAEAMRTKIIAAHLAVKLAATADLLADWHAALQRLTHLGGTHGLISGLAARLVFDAQVMAADDIARLMSQALSTGNDPAAAAAWLEGFLNESGMVLLHDDRLWQMVNEWMSGLAGDHFTRILPLVRRTFATFPEPERQQLGERARRGGGAKETELPVAAAGWNQERAERPLPLLKQILGLT